MTTAKLTDILSIDDLARTVGTPADRILQYAASSNQAAQYEQLYIPKRGRKRRGEYRVVYKVSETWLSQLHRSISMIVVNSASFGNHVQGFIKRRSIRTNALLHLRAEQLLHADITNFFDSITTDQIRLGLVSIGAYPEVADIIARACTIDGFLRQGTRCSPALANVVCRKLDMEMLSLADSCGATYSRYADDITFSGEKTPVSEAVELVLNTNGFKLRDGLCFIQLKGRSQFVTGLSIADEIQPRLPRRLKRRLRLILHFIEKFGIEEHFSHTATANHRTVATPYQLEGMLRFVHAIEPVLAKKLRQKMP
ncbi:MAG TPA: reverse transcriptase family protein [Gallionella sp.]|nr:reverse transcriptase family protein [Gallionella sp.]